MYFITTLGPKSGQRCVGYYKNKEDAIDTVKNNRCDLNEAGCYPHIVIENVEEGLYQYDFEPMWFSYNDVTEEYEECKRPEYIQNCVIGFGIG